MEKKYYVYTYSYPDGTVFYVGKGSGRRFRVHLCDAKAGRNLHLWRVRIISKILRSGNDPVIEIVKDNLTNQEANSLEIELIKKYGRRDIKTGILVNCTDGGDGADGNIAFNASKFKKGDSVSEGKKKHLSVVFSGEKNPFYGKKHSAETRAKMSAMQKAMARRPHTKATKEKLSYMRGGDKNPFYGKSHSSETKRKISESCKGKVGFWSGKQFSKEHLEKLRKEKTCPRCGKTGRGSAMNRYHMENCKTPLLSESV